MSNTKTEYKYIEFNENNVPIIAGTRMKVIELVTSVKAYGWSPEELSFQYPHLTLGQIYSALAYYSDFREEIDAEIEKRYQEAEQQRIEAGESSFAARMRSEGLIT